MAFSDGTADFRSDTVTRPTPEMRRAMADAEVGDDVYGEDPTVNALEEEAAAAVGKQAGLFVPSGMMGNQAAINVHTRPGDEVVCVASAHIRNYELGAASAVSGVAFRAVDTPDGVMTTGQIDAALAASEYHLPGIGLLSWENTHNRSGGTIVPVDVMEAGSARARASGLPVHLDGARLWNAVAASGVPAARYAANADSVMFCFSKGLGAPVGSVVCGTADFIAEARLIRKRLGGGMRQVGVIAAAARVALQNRDRLVDDHVLARDLAAALAARFPEAVSPAEPATNMVLVDEVGLPVAADRFRDALASAGVRVGFMAPGVLRFCTHQDVDAADVARVAGVADAIIGSG